MKKFLSLALALIMTLSLVTISAGATEYKDLTDKDEIQYEEAVAVLNRLGIITGYAEGDFRPQGELTRGAAAKIITSLLIGAEAAEALPKDSSPYSDVPAGSTFAGVISYCKNMKIIDGYNDGTFRSTGTLTGYAFSKMLLGALGYDGKQENFTGPGWTTNVATLGHAANLFDRISFNGGETVNRETACQLALNTLKATEVEYVGGLDVTVGDTQLNAPKTRTYKTSNQEWASHISSRRAGYNMGGNSQISNVNDQHYTVEFGEEHFKDLRMDHDRNTHDQFGRPANEWSYKKVTIGTFALEPDFVYTTQVAHNVATTTSAAKVRALDLNGYDLEADDVTSTGNQKYTNLWLNGALISEDGNDFDETKEVNGNRVIRTSRDYLTKVADIADYTDNGTLVEVYVDDADADFIRDVVVIKTQLMEVRSQKSEAVSLKLYDDASDADGKIIYGYNQSPIDVNVNDVEVNDDLYATLKDKKAGDIVAVVPVWADSKTKYDVAEAYTPETVSGALTRVDTYGNVTAGIGDNYLANDGRGVISATVGGTEYKVALWNKDLYDIDGTSIRVTRKDVTLYMDVYGNAMLATDVGATSNFMVVSGYHSGLVNGRVVTYVDGYDINGNEISLNVGNHNYAEGELNDEFPRGNLVHYKSNTSSNYAEWDLDYLGVYDVASDRRTTDTGATEPYSLRASNGRVLLNGWELDGTRVSDGKTIAISTDGEYKGNDNAGDTKWKFWKASDVADTTNIATDDAGVKFIYVTIGDDGEVDSVEIKDGMQAATNEEILGAGSGFVHKRAQACVSLKNSDTEVNGDSVVKAVVIKQDSSSANLSNLVYIHNYAGSAGRATDNQGRIVYGYEVKFIGASDWDATKTIYSYKNLSIGDFARARKATEVPTEVQGVTEDNFYTLNAYGVRNGVALSVAQTGWIGNILDNNKTLLRMADYYSSNDVPNIHKVWTDDKDLDVGDESAEDIVSIAHAKIIDLTGNDVENATDLKDLWNDVSDADKAAGKKRVIEVAMLFNDKDSDDEFRDVYVLVLRRASINNTRLPITNVVDDGFKMDFSSLAGQKDYIAKITVNGVEVPFDTFMADSYELAAGDKIVITPVDGYKVTVTPASAMDADGVITAADGVKVVVESATIPPADDERTITVKVDGVEDAALTKNVKKGEATTVTYTVPANKTATYKIGDAAAAAVPADGVIPVPAGDADVVIEITLADKPVEPGELNIVICNSAKDAAAANAIKAGITLNEAGDTITVTGIPTDTERYKVTVGANSIQANGTLAYTEGDTIYIQYGSVKGVLGEDGVITTEIIFPTIAADTEGTAPLSAQSIQNAPKYNWEGTNEFILMTIKGEDILMEIMRDEAANKTGYKPVPSKAQFVLDAFNEAGDAGIDLEIKTADSGFGVVNDVEIGIPATNGEGDFTAAEAVKVETIGNSSEKYATANNGYDLYVNGEKVEGTAQLKDGDVVTVVKAADTDPVDNTVRAVESATTAREYKMYLYGTQRALTDAEVKAAVQVASGKEVTKIDGSTGTFKGGQPFTIFTDASASGTRAKPLPLFEVTILGKTEYMYGSETFEVPSTVKALILEGSKVNTTAIANSDNFKADLIRKASATASWALPPASSASGDGGLVVGTAYNFVEALPVNAAALGALNTATYKAWYKDKDGKTETFALTGTPVTYVEKGLAIQLSAQIPANAGQSVTFQLNGKAVGEPKTYSASGYVLSDEIVLDSVVPDGTTDANLTAAIGQVALAAASGITVTFNGETVGVYKAGDDVVLDTSKYPLASVYAATDDGDPDKSKDITLVAAPDGTRFELVGTGKTAPNSDGVLALVSGVEIAANTASSTITYFKDEGCTEKIADKTVIAAGSDVYVQVRTTADDPDTAVFNSFVDVKAKSAPALTLVSTDGPSFYAAGLWKFTADRPIAATDYEIAVALPGDGHGNQDVTLSDFAGDDSTKYSKTFNDMDDGEFTGIGSGATVAVVWDSGTKNGTVIENGKKIQVTGESASSTATIEIKNVTFTEAAGLSFDLETDAKVGSVGPIDVVITITYKGVDYVTGVTVAFS